MEIRAFYIKSLVNAEMDFEYLTSEEQVEMIKKLIIDHNISFPNDSRLLMVIEKSPEMDGSLDW